MRNTVDWFSTCRHCMAEVDPQEAIKGDTWRYYHPACFLEGEYPVTTRTHAPPRAREIVRNLLIEEGFYDVETDSLAV